MKYQYFVSYSHSAPNGSGFGSATYTLDSPMTPALLQVIQEDIAQIFPAAHVVVLNWQRFDAPSE